MEFSQNESEEVKKLKKQLEEERMLTSQLQHSQIRIERVNKDLEERIKQCQSSLNQKEAQLDQAEQSIISIRSERDQYSLSNANLEQALFQSKAHLSQKVKSNRFDEHAREDAFSHIDEEKKQWQEKCKMLECKLRDVQAMKVAGPSSFSLDIEDLPAKLQSLESENMSLKAINQKLQQNASYSDPNDAGRVREQQELREANIGLVRELEKLKERAVRAERETLIASNERLAIEKRTDTVIQSLQAACDDCKEELKLCAIHVNELESQLQAVHTLLETESDTPFDEVKGRICRLIQEGKDIASARIMLMKWQADFWDKSGATNSSEPMNELIVRIVKSYGELDSAYQMTKKISDTNILDIKDLQKRLQESEQASKVLKIREKEMAKAKRRLKMLSGSLQKALPLAAGLQSIVDDGSSTSVGEGVSFSLIGDETAAGANETTIGGLRGFEADMVDEMEQLIAFVEDLDNRLEFRKIEQEIREMNDSSERDRLNLQVSVLKRDLLEARTSMQKAEDINERNIHTLQEENRLAIERAQDAWTAARKQEDAFTKKEKLQAHQKMLLEQDVNKLFQLLDEFHQTLQDEGLRWHRVSEDHSSHICQFAENLVKRQTESHLRLSEEIDLERKKVCQLEIAFCDLQKQSEEEKQRTKFEYKKTINSMKEELQHLSNKIEQSAQTEIRLAELREELTKERKEAEVLQQKYKALEAQLSKDSASKDRKIGEAQSEIDLLQSRKMHMEVEAKELTEALTVSQSTIEHLENELANKAQECEDADDKEIALRKDNKRLLARIATMQARLEKLHQHQSQQQQQQQQHSQHHQVLNSLPAGVLASNGSNGLIPSHSTDSLKDQHVTRKRRNSDMEEKFVNDEKMMDNNFHLTKELHSPKVDRACVYAPAPASLTRTEDQPRVRNNPNHVFRLERRDNQIASRLATGSHGESDAFDAKQKMPSSDEIIVNPLSSTDVPDGQMPLNRSQSRSGTNSKPSDLVALRLQQKMADQSSLNLAINPSTAGTNPVRIKDRTNKPRENMNGKPTLQKDPVKIEKVSSDNQFMAKLNRFRAPSNEISGMTATAMQNYSRAHSRG